MTALLDLPAVRQQLHLWSVEDYRRAGETGVLKKDVELLRGIVVTKMPKSPLHELVAGKLAEILLQQVPKQFKVRREAPLTFKDSEPEPDISVVNGKWDDWQANHPSTASLVVEVAITSEALDVTKAEIYAEAGIAEYWLVRPERRSVEVHRGPGRHGYTATHSLHEDETLKCASIVGVEFKVASIFPSRS
jgi:Uma2 family endonuclease